MKRKVALLLALVMVLSMVPMMSFAASDNRVSKVPTVKDDHKFTQENAPILRIEEKDTDWGATKQTIRLKLENAEWLYETGDSITSAVYNNDVKNVKIYRDSASTITVEFEKVAPATKEAVLNIPMYTEITDPGDATVKVEARGSAVTEGTYVFARSSDGKAIVTIDDNITLSDKAKDIKTIEIDESNPGAYHGNKTVKFKLSSGFIWNESKTDVVSKVRFAGGYAGTDAEVENVVIDDENLEIRFAKLPETKTTRGTIFIEGLTIKADTDAKYGEVNMRVSGTDIDSTTLLVAKYKDYGVVVKADGDAKELVAGKFETSKSDEEHELQKLILKEDIAGSWLSNRKTEIEFPSWVKIRDIEINKSKNISGEPKFTYDKNGNKVEFTFDKKGDGSDKAELELTFYVSVEADATGDITALISGKALDEEHEIVLGKAVAPIEVKTEVKDVKIGVQRQELGKITLKENVAGAFMKDGEVKIELEDGFRWGKDPSVKVIDDGDDLKIDRIKTDKELLTFRVTRESDKPATIEISNIEVDLYRTLPEGEFKVSIGGEALVKTYDKDYENYKSEGPKDDNRDPKFKTEWVAEPVIARVVTPAPDAGTGAKEVVLTIGSTTMFVDGVSETANAAPYIDSADRTMLPVSAIGRALGAKVEWNNAARTVLVTKGTDRVLLTIGSDTMNVNGMNIPMRSKAVITNERTFVPLKDLGVALGVNVEWDAATRTVTIK